MIQQKWRHRRFIVPTSESHFCRVRARSFLATLAGILLLVSVSCAPAPARTSAPASSLSTNHASQRNHVSPNTYWGLVHVTFTVEITYDQARIILSEAKVSIYPMVNPPCGDLRESGAPIAEPTPMSLEELQAAFQRSHQMLVQTDAWEKLNRVASSPNVVAIDPFPLPKNCPAQAPV